MDATQEDLGNDDGASQAPTQSGDSDEAPAGDRESDAGTTDTSRTRDANSGDGAEGSGIAGG